MSVILFTCDFINLPPLNFEPSQIIKINKDNVDFLKQYNINTLPALIKTVSGKSTIFQGIKDIENFKPISLEEIAESLASEKINLPKK